MSIFSDAANALRSWIVAPFLQEMDLSPEDRGRKERMLVYKAYMDGAQRTQLPIKLGKPNDNIIVNLSKKAVNKSVSMLFGGEVRFDLGSAKESDGGEKVDDKQQVYIDYQWEINKKPIFLKKLGKTGATDGTVYIKVLPDEWGDGMHRLVSLDPMQMSVITAPDDCEVVEAYEQIWSYEDKFNGRKRTVFRKERIEQAYDKLKDEEGKDVAVETDEWDVVQFEKSTSTGGKWKETGRERWAYPFPPLVHGQNLPVDGSPYGESDLEGVIGLQDRINFTVSNVSKIVRYHAHPKTIATGMSAAKKNKTIVDGKEIEDTGAVGMSGDEMFVIPAVDAKVYNLEMQSELVPAMGFLSFLIESFYNLTATVDMSTVKDRLGQLTNFGLHVLFQDAMEKLQDKRDLYGELLTELNRRLLVLGGFGEYQKMQGGEVVWPANVTPEDEEAESRTIIADMGAGILDQETAAGLRGYDWEVVKKRKVENQANQNGELGAQLTRLFNQGGGL